MSKKTRRPQPGDRRIMARWAVDLTGDIEQTEGPFSSIADAQAYSERESATAELGVAVIQEYQQYDDWWHTEWVDIEEYRGGEGE